MSKRLQVIVRDADLDAFERAARAEGLTLSEWVRQALGAGLRSTSPTPIDSKLGSVRAALRHDYPSADIDVMLSEVEGGYGRTT